MNTSLEIDMTPENIVGITFGICGMYFFIRGLIESDPVKSQMHRIEGLLCITLSILMKVIS